MISSSAIPVPSSSRSRNTPGDDATADLAPLSSSSSHSQSHMHAHQSHRDHRPSTRGSDTSDRDLYYAAQAPGESAGGGGYLRDERRDSYTTYDTALPAGSGAGMGPLDTIAPALDSALVTSAIPSDPLPVVDRVPVDVDYYRSASPADRRLGPDVVGAEATRGETLATTTTQATTTESTSAPAVTETDLTGGTTSSAAAEAAPLGGLVGAASHANTEFVAPEAKLGRRVVVLAMDDSPASQAALTWTLNQLVSPSRDHLIVLTVAFYKTAGLLKTNEEKTAKRELKAEEQAQIVVNYAAAHIAQWIESLKISLSFELVTLKAADGKVQEVITDYARDINSNVLILGSHAGGTIRKTLFGSTATYCLTHATTPVIVVREEGTVMAA